MEPDECEIEPQQLDDHRDEAPGELSRLLATPVSGQVQQGEQILDLSLPYKDPLCGEFREMGRSSLLGQGRIPPRIRKWASERR